MKKIRYRIVSLVLPAALLAILAGSCAKKTINEFYPDRMFTPTSISMSSADTAITISWPASLFSAGRGATYTLEISKDSTFQATPDVSLQADTNFRTIGDDTLRDRQKYFVRVKANAISGATESDWVTATSGFTLVGVQIFKPLNDADIIDDEVILNWTTTPGVTEIVLTAAGGGTINVPISDSLNNAGQVTVTGLTGGTTYTAEIFAGTKSKGLLTFTTKTAVTGSSVVDLRGVTDDPLVLYDTLSQIPDGSIVLLKRGMTYTIPSAYTFDRSVTIMSGLGYGDQAILSLENNFDANGTIDSLEFIDLTLANAGGAYFMNVGHTATIGKLLVKNCVTTGVYSNSFIRLKTSDDLISELDIDNCIIDSIGNSAKYPVFYANASSTAKIDNINITNSTFYACYYFIREQGVTCSSLVINNVTFNDMVNQGGYFINYTASFPPTFTISNTILGKTSDPTNANGIPSSGIAVWSNTYMTSDCTFSANPISGPTAYAGTYDALFNDPDHGDFTFKDNGFAGKSTAGDPRWR